MNYVVFRLVAAFWLVFAGIGGAVADPLPPERAFRPSARALDGQTVEVRFKIADGYYLYRDKFRFAVEPATVKLGVPSFPLGQVKADETFGQVEVYESDVAIRLPVERTGPGPLPLLLHVSSQGCADVGVCYPPQKQSISVELPDPAIVPVTPEPHDESGRIAAMLAHASSAAVAASFFGFGLLLAFTPCTFPLLPIVSGIVLGAGRGNRSVSRGRALALSLAYVVGMAVTHAVAGVIAGFTGTLLSSALQNAWVLGGLALVFVILAMSMFGLFELQVPSFLQTRISEEAAHLRGGSIPTVVLMGALSSLVVGPCVAAPLAGALLYIGRTGDALLGGLALFCLGLGMGAPLVVAGVSTGSLLPRAGPWMAAINACFGVVLLAGAVWIISPLIPVAVQMLAWALLLIVPAIYLHALDPLPPQARGWQRFGKAIGVIMLLAGAAMLIGVLSGGRNPLQPLAGIGTACGSEAQPLPFEPVRSSAELDARVARAGRPVLLDFHADWCVSCKEIEHFTLSDPRVRAKLSGWLLLRADVTANSAEDKALLARFQLFGPPAIIFFDPRGREVVGTRVVGFQGADEFLRSLAASRM